MGMPSHQHHLEYGEVERGVRFLRHDCDLPCDRARGEQANFAVIKPYGAEIRLEHSGQQLQQRGLAAAVRTEQSRQRPGCDADADVPQREFGTRSVRLQPDLL
jgi:hypothetical protein